MASNIKFPPLNCEPTFQGCLSVILSFGKGENSSEWPINR